MTSWKKVRFLGLAQIYPYSEGWIFKTFDFHQKCKSKNTHKIAYVFVAADTITVYIHLSK